MGYGNIHTSSLQERSHFWLKVCDSTDRCGYADSLGNVKIELGKYSYCFTDTMYTFAVVYKASAGIVAINKKEEELFKVYTVDNGPDYYSEGLFRIVKNNLIGFANRTGDVVIKPQFTYVEPFGDGLAAYCNSCKVEQKEEHVSLSDGLWGFVNKRGEIVYQAKYKRIQSLVFNKWIYGNGIDLFVVINGKLSKLTENEQMQLVDELIALKEYEKALEILKKAEKSDPNDYHILISIASIYKQQGDNENAIVYCNKIIEKGDEKEKEIAAGMIRGLSIK
jgi:tetratricopeptide (TPR) repeat protein